MWYQCKRGHLVECSDTSKRDYYCGLCGKILMKNESKRLIMRITKKGTMLFHHYPLELNTFPEFSKAIPPSYGDEVYITA